MRIIGEANGNYLVEISEDEIAYGLGYSGVYGENWKNFSGAYKLNGRFRVGTTIKLKEGVSFLPHLLSKEGEAKRGAATLRALADLIDQNLPSVIIPPPEPEAPAAEGTIS